MGNKVKFGLKNGHYATFTTDETTGEIIYDAPKPLKGSVELSLEPRGDMVEFYADDMLFYSAPNNQGYDGTLSIALIPDSFAVDVLGEEQDETDGVLTEKTDAKPKNFALMFEFNGDKKATRHVLYNCSANRPTVSSSTKTDSVEPTPDELTFVASPRDTDYAVKTKTTENTTDEVYKNWYKKVYEKGQSTGGGVEA
ncbi:major tail protein [Virgibacillus salexigens]|uniref:major tail protein n=1 Tax=Virgibacillus salexigens TaxID=61016 RepID=UPI0030814F02